MDNNPFQNRSPHIAGNPRIRTPQREAYDALARHSAMVDSDREIGIVLPVGCGKSGCITLAPFAFQSMRTLVVAPGVRIAEQLHGDFNPSLPSHFYTRCDVLPDQPFPEPVEIRGTTTNRGDLDSADIVITNIQQLQGAQNRWLASLPHDYFDLILFDEGHHSVAATWENLKQRFPNARIVNFSATPLRADGQLMTGQVIYSYPIFRAIQEGYVKRLKALVLNPRTLRYVRREDNQEIEVPLEEVRRLGEEDADFRRSIVTSRETLITIVDASIRELRRIREATGDRRHKIIAAALNYEHCRQIVQAYAERSLRADFVHSREDGAANTRVLTRLEGHDLDVIVQVRKLGEGFDHPHLSVAAVFSVFSNLSPFVQFVGRIMRVIVQNDPAHPMNQGTVVFHAGANIASRWEDFQSYSAADQAFFEQLLPVENIDFASADEIAVEPVASVPRENPIEVRSQSQVVLQEIPLLENDPDAQAAIDLLRSRGYSPEAVRQAMELQPIPTTRAAQRQAARGALHTRIQTDVGRILGSRRVNPQGRDLDKKHIGQVNFAVLAAAINRRVNGCVGRGEGERPDFTQPELDQIDREFPRLVQEAEQEVFGNAQA